jgi:hypothetical protein
MKMHAPSRFLLTASFATLMLLVSSTPVLSAGGGSLPRSALPGTVPLDQVELRVMPLVDVGALRAEDVERENSGAPVAPRFATNLGVALTPENSGTWETIEDGARLWRLSVTSAGALNLSLGLKTFDLPKGARFWVHAPDGSWVQGPYTGENRNALGGLWTAMVLGEEIVAELHVPEGAEAGLEITSVNHGYRFFGERESEISAKRGSCNVNVVCPEGNKFAEQIRSVARITYSEGSDLYACTAQLLNNTSEDETPLLYSAGHCLNTDEAAATLVAYWNYQTATCEDRYGGSLSQNQSGATLLAHSYESSTDYRFDFSLMELDEMPDEAFDVFYSGWDARDRTPPSTVAIHHPNADQKSISFDYDPPMITSLGGTSSPGDGGFLRVVDWDLGTTEFGSSGGCLWDESSGLCVGSLTGGDAACSNNASDWYSRIRRQWTGEGTTESRLSDWLDPEATGAEYLFGRNPGAGAPTSETWLIPAVASTPGAEGSNWKSQVSVANTSTTSRNAMVYFVPDGEEWPGELLSGPHMIGPLGSLFLDDPLLPLSPIAGLMYISVDGEDTIAFSRTFNLDNDATFGQGMPGISLSDATLQTEFILPMVHSAPGRFRTNIGWAQASGGLFRVWVELYSADSVLLAARRYPIDTAWRQIDDIFGKMGVGDEVVEGGWIRVILTFGSPAYWTTYATVIDDQTNDPTYILPVAQ